MSGAGRPALTATYRLQLGPDFGFAAAAQATGYLARLGVSHLYLSPVLQATPGSTHGYDVTDHSRLADQLGGAAGFAALVAAAHEHGLGIIVDVVPNHMGVPTPASLNAPLWSVLRSGPASPYAGWFDVDWAAQDRAILMPVLGRRIGQCLADGEIELDSTGPEPVLRYYEHVFPVRAGTETLPLPQLVDRQFYRLAHWRVADEELNYRRFFDVDTLAALRVERPEVFDATHELLLRLHRHGDIDGFRIDHPDGLADPRGYLARLAEASGGAWVVVEKILEGSEVLPADWACAGTTGYDALQRVLGVMLDSRGAAPLAALHTSLSGAPAEFEPVVAASKREVVEAALHPETQRLVELLSGMCRDDIMLRDFTERGLREALVELLVAMPVYRAYVVPGEPADEAAVQLLEDAAAQAVTRAPERADEVALLVDLALGRRGRGPRRDEFCVRFQQTCGPVMAKGVEDTAFYRWFRLAALNEVGGDPGRFGWSVDELHAWAERQARDFPAGLTTLSTHDTKRSEDVRARLALLTEVAGEWSETLTRWRERAAGYRSGDRPDAELELLLWQTVVGAWPIEPERLIGYLTKAAREAKTHTWWTSPAAEYEQAIIDFATAVLTDPALRHDIEGFVERLAAGFRSNVLAQRLVQLTLPGVPDVYQGCESVSLRLVDPDNRSAVDFAAAEQTLAALDQGDRPITLEQQKVWVTATALRLRREHPEAFGAQAGYQPLPVTSAHAIAFTRAERVATVATRLPVALAEAGGWGQASVALPPGRWTDQLTGVEHDGARPLALADLLEEYPVALLLRTPGNEDAAG